MLNTVIYTHLVGKPLFIIKSKIICNIIPLIVFQFSLKKQRISSTSCILYHHSFYVIVLSEKKLFSQSYSFHLQHTKSNYLKT